MNARADRFLRALRRQDVDTTPVWLMRQAGRSLPAYRELRARHGFLDVIAQPELMAEVTMLPLRYMEVDAAVMFADIMLPLSSLGVAFDIVESVGPVIADPVRTREQVDAMTSVPVAEACPTVPESIRLVRKELDGVVPVIGFSGAPFTLASYLVEGKPSKEFAATRELMFRDPVTWHALMDRLTDMAIDYLGVQVDAGAQALQLFDSWIGVLAPGEVETHVLPYTQRVFEAIAGEDVPTIHFGTGTSHLLELMARPACDAVSVDWRVGLDDAWRRIGHDKGIQGNLDPAVLCGPPDLVVDRARQVLEAAGGRPGHVFNLGHGVLPGSRLDNLKLLVDTVHELGART